MRSDIPVSVLLLLVLTFSLPITAESSFFGSGPEEEGQNECPIMSFTCDETPGVLEKIYLDDGISFQETNDIFPPIGILRGGHDMVKLGILIDENGEEFDWSDSTEAQKTKFEEEHGILPPKENTNSTKRVGGVSNVSTNTSSIAGLSSSPSPAELDPAPTSPQPLAQQQTVPQNTQDITTNIGDTGNTRNVNLLNSSSYIDSIGSLHVIGELQNTSPDPREFVKIVATLRDPSDNILDSSFTYSEVEVLRPGEKSPFDVIFSNEQQVQKTQRYDISSITSEISQEKPANLKLNVGDSFYDSINSAHVVGEVTNNGPGVSKFTKVSGIFYDDQNKTVATGFTYTDPSDLQPGQSASFDMIISDHASANMASGSLNVQSSEYAMILPAVIFEMNGQSDGDSAGDLGSLGGGPINEPPDDRPTPPEEEPPEEEPPEEEPPEEEPPEEEEEGEDGQEPPLPLFGNG